MAAAREVQLRISKRWQNAVGGEGVEGAGTLRAANHFCCLLCSSFCFAFFLFGFPSCSPSLSPSVSLSLSLSRLPAAAVVVACTFCAPELFENFLKDAFSGK